MKNSKSTRILTVSALSGFLVVAALFLNDFILPHNLVTGFQPPATILQAICQIEQQKVREVGSVTFAVVVFMLFAVIQITFFWLMHKPITIIQSGLLGMLVGAMAAYFYEGLKSKKDAGLEDNPIDRFADSKFKPLDVAFIACITIASGLAYCTPYNLDLRLRLFLIPAAFLLCAWIFSSGWLQFNVAMVVRPAESKDIRNVYLSTPGSNSPEARREPTLSQSFLILTALYAALTFVSVTLVPTPKPDPPVTPILML